MSAIVYLSLAIKTISPALVIIQKITPCAIAKRRCPSFEKLDISVYYKSKFSFLGNDFMYCADPFLIQ